jgi:hypothetical protein
MSDSEDNLKSAPSIQPDPARLEAATMKAMEAFNSQHERKRVIVPFVASFLGAAAALAIAFVLFQAGQGRGGEQVPGDVSVLSRVEIVQAYAELRGTFPEGLAAIVFVGDEMRIYPGQVGEGAVEPTYMEMLVESTRVRVVAAQGASLPVMVKGATVSFEFMSDVDDLPIVSGEDFYWSKNEQYLPTGREILEVERLALLL